MVKRYVAAMIRDAKTEEGLTEENFKVGSSYTANNCIKAVIINISMFTVDYMTT